MTFFHLRHPQKSRGFSGVFAAASSGGHFIHSLLDADHHRAVQKTVLPAGVMPIDR
jgi:hypothetical protein